MINTLKNKLNYDQNIGLRHTHIYGRDEFWFNKNDKLYFITLHNGIWELFRVEQREGKYGRLQEVFVRVVEGTNGLYRSIELFNEYLGGLND